MMDWREEGRERNGEEGSGERGKEANEAEKSGRREETPHWCTRRPMHALAESAAAGRRGRKTSGACLTAWASVSTLFRLSHVPFFAARCIRLAYVHTGTLTLHVLAAYISSYVIKS